MKYIVFITSTLVSIQVLADTADQWGSWGQPPDQFRQQMESGQLNEGKNLYGSGIAGTDEKLLHELDQSSLLDYQRPTATEYTASLMVSDQSSDLSYTRIEVTFTGANSLIHLNSITNITESVLPDELVVALDAAGIAAENIESITFEIAGTGAPEIELDAEIKEEINLQTVAPSAKISAE